MKQIRFTLLFLFGLGLVSCRRDKVEPDIKTYDQQQIQAYIAANGLTGMQIDTTGRSTGTDTTGIWYKIIDQGSGQPLAYSDFISSVYTIRTLDGKYDLHDTVTNHSYGLLGHVAPNGLMLALHNILKYRGGKFRVLIPSHLAYGKNGAGQGSSTVTNGRIGGNQCLDYTFYIVPDQAAYDDLVIRNYIAANNLSGYAKTADGLYYKITKAPTGANSININSSVSMTYTAQLMNNAYADNQYATTATTFSDLISLTPGFKEGLFLLGKGGGSISMIVPSGLAYGTSGSSGNGVNSVSIPTNACLRFEVTVTDVTN